LARLTFVRRADVNIVTSCRHHNADDYRLWVFVDNIEMGLNQLSAVLLTVFDAEHWINFSLFIVLLANVDISTIDRPNKAALKSNYK